MKKEGLEFLQMLLMIVMLLTMGVIAHHVAVAFDVVKAWYLLLISSAGYYRIEQKL